MTRGSFPYSVAITFTAALAIGLLLGAWGLA